MRNPALLILALITVGAYAQSPADRGRKLFEENNNQEAKKVLLAVDKSSKDYPMARYYLGRIAFNEKKLDDAQEFFEEAVEGNDKVAEYHTWLGNAYGQIASDANMIRQGMLAPKMKAEWERAVQLDQSAVEPRQSLIQYYLKAPGFLGGSVEKAKEVAKQILSLNAAQGHFQMGNIYLHEKNTAAAEKEYLEMVKIDPAYVPGLANFYLSQKQTDKAFNLFEEAIKRNPDDMASVYQIGKASALSGQRLDRGEECLRKYLLYTPKANEPSLAGAHMRLAQVMEKKGDKATAKKYYETSLRLDNNLKDAKEGLERVSK